MMRGFRHGFHIGFDLRCSLKPAPSNFRSVRENPVVVDAYIASEVAAGRLVESTDPSVRRNPIGIIPKPNQPGKFRLIVDLSAPMGHSVNDGISPTLCSLKYLMVDQAARAVAECGQGTLMAKVDLHSAYRHVPVHSGDQHLLGLEWKGVTYVDKALPFGLRSAPKVFSAVADSLTWALQCEGIQNCVHYLDDFLLWGSEEEFRCWGSPKSSEGRVTLTKVADVCARLGLPLAPDKSVGPTTTLTFLGIEIDSVAQELRLPREKLARLRHTLIHWQGKQSATKQQLQELNGWLNHAASVVRPGRTFTRHLIETAKIPRRQCHKVRLNADCRADLAWWATFAQVWNGVAIFPPLRQGASLVSDASGSWGCGAYVQEDYQWFQVAWPSSWKSVNIAVKELLPIVVSAAVWGESWRGLSVIFWSDNQAVVECLSSRTARDPHLAHLLRCLFFFEAYFDFGHSACHIAGRLNVAADALSRDKLHDFFSLHPQAPRSPVPVPDSLIDLLTDSSLRWTSRRWRALFELTLHRVLPQAQ